MSTRLVIFDCDGVLFESRAANEAFFNHILARFHRPPLTEAHLDIVHASTTEEALNYILPPEILAEAQAFRLTVDYTPFYRHMVLEPSLIELLTFLRRNPPGFLTAVCTNRGPSIKPVLDDFGLAGYFDTVVSCLDVSRPKPDPEPLNLILTRLQVKAEQTLYVGDTLVDARAAQAAGIPLAAYRNPALPAAYHIDSLRQLKDIVIAS